MEFELSQVHSKVSGNYNIGCAHISYKPVYEICKRMFDLFCASAALFLLSPLLLMIAVIIFVSDGHSPFFLQERVGINGTFKMIKFRTMVTGAEKKRDEVIKNAGLGVTLLHKCENDPRITKVGAFLRKSSIDELPQLINIIKDDMSIIGPRPLVPKENEEINNHMRCSCNRNVVKPGLSSYAVLDPTSRDNYKNWSRLDEKYIHERSFLADIKIIFKTVLSVVLGKNK